MFSDDDGIFFFFPLTEKLHISVDPNNAFLL